MRAAVCLLAGIASLWCFVTVVNGLRLGPRGSDPGLYWPATIVIAVASVALGLVVRRLWQR